jgi:hypothetical protein
LEWKRGVFKEYGTTVPEKEYEQVYDDETGTATYISAKDFVDSIRQRLREIEARIEKKRRYALADKMRAINPLIRVRVR